MPQPAHDIRAERQAALDARVAELRASADRKQAEADRLHGTVDQDGAFWTQPAYGNAAGRAFAAHRNRERGRLVRASEMAAEARELRAQADRMEKAGARVAGDAQAQRDAVVAACTIAVGDLADTTHYGVRKVLKVNAKTVLVEGAFGPLKVEKQFVRRAA